MTNRPHFALLLTLTIAGCSGGGAYRAAPVMVQTSAETGGAVYQPPTPSYETAPSAQSEVPPEQRAGLATQWGEQRYSRVSQTRFVRNDPSRPLVLAAVHYNDAMGSAIQAARAAGQSPVEHVSLVDPAQGGHGVHVSLRDEYGRSLPAYFVDGRPYVVGEAGRRYSIHIENRTPYRLEAVISVDGLDVIRGEAAALTTRGYIVHAWDSLTIEGFRQSSESVAAFRFGAVSSSYAAQMTGSAANVGVIGVALFGEAGVSLPTTLVAEAAIRERANPFPGYAAPPPMLYVQ
jgi:hypothetical protein